MSHTFQNHAILAHLTLLILMTPVQGQPQAARLIDSYVRISDHASLRPQQFTIEFRFTPRGIGSGNTTLGAGAALVMKSREGAGGNYLSSWAFQWSPVDYRLNFAVAHQIEPYGTNVYASQTIPMNTTARVAGTFDGATLRIYVDGVLGGTIAYPYSGVDYGSDDVLIGAANHCCGFSRQFDGEIDDVRLWDHARSAAQIQSDMNCEADSGAAGLLAAWNFNDSNLRDVSGHGHDGIAFGNVGFVSNPLTPCSVDCNTNGLEDPSELAANPVLDANSNGTLDSCEHMCPNCPGDVNGDNRVDSDDISGFVRCFLNCGATSDHCPCADTYPAGVPDGTLDSDDLSAFLVWLLTKADLACQ